MASLTGKQAGGPFNVALTKLLRDVHPDLGGHWEAMRVHPR